MKEDDLRKKLLRILYISQYFPPEIGATQTRAYEMVRYLTAAGHRVTVLTEFPNHPLGVIPSQYRYKIFTRERMHGIDVLRTWVFARPEKNFLVRLGFYLSFMWMSILRGVFIREKFDVVYATSPPLFVAVSGFIIALVKGCRFVLEIRDLWPESAVVLGELTHKQFIALSEKLEIFLYNKAVRLIGVTQGICNRLKEKGVPETKLSFIPNGVNVDLYRPGKKDRLLLRLLGIDVSSFVVAYTGLHGLMHGLDFVLETACELQSDSQLFFVFIGDGVRKQHLIDLAGQYQLKNVRFLNGVAEKELPRYIQSFDAGLATTKKMAFCRGTLPVKMFSYMACAKPVLLCVEGEAEKILQTAGGGLSVEPENVVQLKKAILKLKNNPALRKQMGQAGRRFVEKNYSRKQKAVELEELLLKIVTKE